MYKGYNEKAAILGAPNQTYNRLTADTLQCDFHKHCHLLHLGEALIGPCLSCLRGERPGIEQSLLVR
jgi:hypothetical protein